MSAGNDGRGLSSGGYYFAREDQVAEDLLRLSPDEARHAVRVLRLGIGDEIAVVDGLGGWYRGRIEVIDRNGLTASIQERRQDVGEPTYRFTIAIGVLKQLHRFETFLEKAVELGVTRIVPTITARSQSTTLNLKRCQRILVAGMKQSLRSRIPELTEPRRFESIVKEDAAIKLIAHESTSPEDSMLTHSEAIMKASSCSILIGSEGGFSDDEIGLAQREGWATVSLGTSRLRTETAGIAAASIVQMIKSGPAK